MHKWEYLNVYVDYAGGWRVRPVQGTELPDWKKKGHSDVLNRLGDDGRELVVVAPYDYMCETKSFHYSFKRPKAE